MKRRTLILLRLLMISSLLMAGYGAVLKYEVMAPLGIQREESIMELPFVLLADDELACVVSDGLQAYLTPVEETQPPVTEPPAEEAATEPVPEEIPETQPPTEPEPILEPVEDNWFDKTLFIGDSRTEGLRYADCLGEAEYFSDVGMTVYSAMGVRRYSDGYGYNYLGTVLKNNPYDKIFIHLGLNECGGDHERFLKEYRKLVEAIQQAQPETTLIIQEIMTVSKGKATDSRFSLERIGYLNSQLQLIAEEYGACFMDTNGFVSDEEGYLLEELNRDGYHLYATGYQQWADWIRLQASAIETK